MSNEQTGNGSAVGGSPSNGGLYVFHASYYWSGGYGAFDSKEYVIVANTSSEALGMALEAEPQTKAKDWSVARIETAAPSVTFINSQGS